MSMCHPSLNTTGKKKGKVKFRNAAEAQRARELDASWKDLQKKWGVETEEKKRSRALKSKTYVPPALTHRGVDEPKIASVNTGWHACTRAADKVYTGTAIVGISTLHKSNAVPVFSKQDAIDISKMRRG